MFFDKFFEWMKEMGYTDRKRASELLDDLIEAGLAEGNDEIGYILTLARAKKKLYGSFVF